MVENLYLARKNLVKSTKCKDIQRTLTALSFDLKTEHSSYTDEKNIHLVLDPMLFVSYKLFLSYILHIHLFFD